MTDSSEFEPLREHLGDTVSPGERILAIALAWSGPRIFTNGYSGSGLRQLLSPTFALLTWIGSATQVSTPWLLAVTESRLVAVRLGTFSTIPTGETKSFDPKQGHQLNIVDSFLSGWLVEVGPQGESTKYAVYTPSGVEKSRLGITKSLKWSFESFASTLSDSWKRASA